MIKELEEAMLLYDTEETDREEADKVYEFGDGVIKEAYEWIDDLEEAYQYIDELEEAHSRMRIEATEDQNDGPQGDGQYTGLQSTLPRDPFVLPPGGGQPGPALGVQNLSS